MVTRHPYGDTFAEFLDSARRLIDFTLEEYLKTPKGAPERLYEAMRYSALAPGKRLRGTLCLAVHKAYGEDGATEHIVAAALEMVHTYSLIHDDLPCMDNDDVRRGRPTLHKAFDEATAVLAGDALQALAFELLARFARPQVTELIAKAVGPSGMAGGQMEDLLAEGSEPSEEVVIRIHAQKTARLIAASVVSGAFCDGIRQTVDQEALSHYGYCLGLAFQIVDDILEMTQSPDVLGKPTDSDSRHRKATYPGAVGIDRARAKALELVDEAKDALSPIHGDKTNLLAIADFIVSRDR